MEKAENSIYDLIKSSIMVTKLRIYSWLYFLSKLTLFYIFELEITDLADLKGVLVIYL